MNNEFIECYNRELIYLRELSVEFANRHPDIAGRLSMKPNETPDPYVERLLEGIAFLTSRVKVKMDSEFPRFTESLLEMIYPNYLSFVPSVGIVELVMDEDKGGVRRKFTVPRNSFIQYQAFAEKGTTVGYTTTQDVKLHPLTVTNAGFTGPQYINIQGRESITSEVSLTLQFTTFESTSLGYCDIDDLNLYISGASSVSLPLLEMLLEHNRGAICQIAGENFYLERSLITHEGFGPAQALLPNDLRNFDAFRFLQEFFILPEKFMFFKVDGLKEFINKFPNEKQFTIDILLDACVSFKKLAISKENFMLHCTPVINLFKKTAERVEVNNLRKEQHIVVDKGRPLDYEIFSIQTLYGSNDNYETEIFKPFWGSFSRIGEKAGTHFSMRREQRLPSQHASLYGSRSNYSGSEVFVSIVDENNSPWNDDLKYLTAEVLCSNRDIPLLLTDERNKKFILSDSLPVKCINFVIPPTAPKPPMAKGIHTWLLISQLQINYLSLLDLDAEKGAVALRQILHLYARSDDISVKNQIESILKINFSPIARKVIEKEHILFARGLSVVVEIDEESYAGCGAWLIGSVLARLFSRLVTINSFTDTMVKSQQRGVIGVWLSQTGKRVPI